MDPQHPYTNGDGGEEEDPGGDGAGAEEAGVSVEDAEGPARVLLALDRLRKSRQHYDVVLVAGAGGGEVAAHRAVLAAASPYLLRELAGGGAAYTVRGVAAGPLRALLQLLYAGRLPRAAPAAARAVYAAAWRLRLEPARALLAAALLRRLAPADCLATRALPGLEPHHRRRLDAYIADNFEEVCECGALAALPEVRVELMRDSRAAGGESPRALADAALAWLLRDAAEVEELCSRTHLLYVDAAGALRDCGELPAARGDAPELQQYRREAAARRRPPPAAPEPGAAEAEGEEEGPQLGARALDDECGVVAARRAPGGSVRALLVLHGRLAGARLLWTAVAAGGGGVARGPPLQPALAAGLAEARAAHGAAALGGRLLVCGGYDRARVLRSAEALEPAAAAWGPLPDMRGPRARFPAAALGDEVWVLGGSDGHAELDSVDAFSWARGWRGAARLPAAVQHAAAAAHAGALFVVGGWAGGAVLRRVWRYAAARWEEAPALGAARAQCAAVSWRGALWALGGCDAWRCLAGAERLPAGGAAWEAGPALPTARRSMGGAEWRGLLVSAGGSDGAASLRRVDWLRAGAEAWEAGPALRRPRAALALAELQGDLYAVGGFDGKEFLSCAEVLSAPDAEWTTLTARPAPRHLADAPQEPPPEREEGEGETEPPPQ